MKSNTVFLVATMIMLVLILTGIWSGTNSRLAAIQKEEAANASRFMRLRFDVARIASMVESQPTPAPAIIITDRPAIPEVVVMVDVTGRMCVGKNMHSLQNGMYIYYSLVYCTGGVK